MVTREDVESFMARMDLNADEVEEGMWVIETDEDGPKIVVSYTPPLIVFRLKVLDIPSDQQKCAELYRRLLELNAIDLVHGAYGVEEGDVILTEAMELENLDFNEFQAAVDSFQMATASHYDALAPYRNC